MHYQARYSSGSNSFSQNQMIHYLMTSHPLPEPEVPLFCSYHLDLLPSTRHHCCIHLLLYRLNHHWREKRNKKLGGSPDCCFEMIVDRRGERKENGWLKFSKIVVGWKVGKRKERETGATKKHLGHMQIETDDIYNIVYWVFILFSVIHEFLLNLHDSNLQHLKHM